MAKQNHLVCQYLENISREALMHYQDIIRDFVKGRHGVYALFHGKQLYYVGLATDLRKRLNQHFKNRHGESWDHFSIYLTIGEDHLKELESLVLRIVRPKGNRVLGNFPKSENLRQRLERGMKQYDRDRQRRLLGGIKESRRTSSPPQPKQNGKQTGSTHCSLASYIQKPLRLRGRYKNRLYRATIRRDGLIRYAGKLYPSPSAAGAAARCRTSCDGWIFWQYERAPGDWVPLRQLRR